MSIRILILSDSHLFKTEESELFHVNTHRSLKQLTSQIHREGDSFDLLVACGDLSEDGSTRSYEFFEKITGGLSGEVIWVPGNHDQFGNLTEIQRNQFFQNEWHSGRWSLIFLDTTVQGSDRGVLGAEEIDRLRRFILDHSSQNVWIFMHHHPLEVGSDFIDILGLKNGEDFWSAIEGYQNVKGMVFGHVHQVFEKKTRGKKCLSVPSTAMQFKPDSRELDFEDIPSGYRVLSLHPDGTTESWIERKRI